MTLLKEGEQDHERLWILGEITFLCKTFEKCLKCKALGADVFPKTGFIKINVTLPYNARNRCLQRHTSLCHPRPTKGSWPFRFFVQILCSDVEICSMQSHEICPLCSSSALGAVLCCPHECSFPAGLAAGALLAVFWLVFPVIQNKKVKEHDATLKVKQWYRENINLVVNWLYFGSNMFVCQYGHGA